VVPWNAPDVRALVPRERWAPVRRVFSRRELEQCETDAVWLDASARQVHVRMIGTASQVEKLIVLQTP
jgi:hypothetical protein